MSNGCIVTPVAAEGGSSMRPHHEAGKRKVREEESAVEYIQVLLAMEIDSYPCCKDYLSSPDDSSSTSGPSDQGGITEAWRRKLCEWSYEVVDHFGFDREVVSIALDYLDRSVALRTGPSKEPLAKKDFQLLAVTSLYTAIKTHGLTESADGPRRKLKIEAFTQLSRGVFSVETIEAMERQILADLQWRVNPPTNLRFIAYFLKLLPVWTTDGDFRSHAHVKNILYEISRYLAELSVCVSVFSFSFNSSVIAFAAILCALDVLQERIQLPFEARGRFLENIAEAASLRHDSQEVGKARTMLKELCPSMFERDDFPSEFRFGNSDVVGQDGDAFAGKSSPVCVVQEFYESPSTSRKRSRTAGA